MAAAIGSSKTGTAMWKPGLCLSKKDKGETMIQRVKQLKNAVIVLLVLLLAFGASCRRLKENQMALTLNANGEVQLKLDGEGPVTIDWGDGSPWITRDLIPLWSENADENKNAFKNAYSGKPPYTITISGENITDLDCGKMGLTAIDVRKNAKLEVLECSDNQLTQMDVRSNSKLRRLKCEKNQLTKIDLSKNPDLISLSIDENKLKNLDVSNNAQLAWLYCNNNQLTSLNLSKNPLLDTLRISGNKLTNLDLSNNKQLLDLHVESNSFSTQALNDLFATLRDTPAFDTSKLIYINGNPGTNDCNIKILEGNGWERAYLNAEDMPTYTSIIRPNEKLNLGQGYLDKFRFFSFEKYKPPYNSHFALRTLYDDEEVYVYVDVNEDSAKRGYPEYNQFKPGDILEILWKLDYIKTPEQTPPIAPVALDVKNAAITMPAQSYLGEWHSAENAPDILIISEITRTAIKFEVSVYRIGDIYAIAKIENNEIKFIGNAVGAEGPFIKGRLVFKENSVSVFIDESEFEYIKAGYNYDFHIKASG
jgi:hypothetical protein